MATHSNWIDIAAVDGAFQAYLALPHTRKGPAIVIIQDQDSDALAHGRRLVSLANRL